MPTKSRLFRIAIVGRPNVGKSTLFNRLLGERKAITSPEPGVTRDRVEAVRTLQGHEVLLIDTGGYRAGMQGLELQITEISLQTVDEADLVLLVVDVTEQTGEDLGFVEQLRRHQDKVVLVVNKVDSPQREGEVWNFHRLGFESVVGVSSTHGRNMDQLENIILRRIELWRPPGTGEAEGGAGTAVADSATADEAEGRLRLAILGKPNTGKSTLLNTLLGEQRALVSAVPGTTRDTIEGSFRFRDTSIEVIDTAGIRRKSRVEESIEYYAVNRAIGSIEQADIVYLMVDAVEGLSDQDKKIAALIIDQGKGVLLVLNKWDLLAGVSNRFQAVQDRTRFLFPLLEFAPLVAISALNGQGLPRLLENTLRVWQQLNRRVETGPLNRHLREWVIRSPVPGRGRNFKVRYATQVSIRPVRFVFFVNRLAGFPRRYAQYLTNRIRQDLGFDLVPIEIEFRESPGGRE